MLIRADIGGLARVDAVCGWEAVEVEGDGGVVERLEERVRGWEQACGKFDGGQSASDTRRHRIPASARCTAKLGFLRSREEREGDGDAPVPATFANLVVVAACTAGRTCLVRFSLTAFRRFGAPFLAPFTTTLFFPFSSRRRSSRSSRSTRRRSRSSARSLSRATSSGEAWYHTVGSNARRASASPKMRERMKEGGRGSQGKVTK